MDGKELSTIAYNDAETTCREGPQISVSPPALLNLQPDEVAEFTLTLSATSETEEGLVYSLVTRGDAYPWIQNMLPYRSSALYDRVGIDDQEFELSTSGEPLELILKLDRLDRTKYVVDKLQYDLLSECWKNTYFSVGFYDVRASTTVSASWLRESPPIDWFESSPVVWLPSTNSVTLLVIGFAFPTEPSVVSPGVDWYDPAVDYVYIQYRVKGAKNW